MARATARNVFPVPGRADTKNEVVRTDGVHIYFLAQGLGSDGPFGRNDEHGVLKNIFKPGAGLSRKHVQSVHQIRGENTGALFQQTIGLHQHIADKLPRAFRPPPRMVRAVPSDCRSTPLSLVSNFKCSLPGQTIRGPKRSRQNSRLRSYIAHTVMWRVSFLPQ